MKVDLRRPDGAIVVAELPRGIWLPHAVVRPAHLELSDEEWAKCPAATCHVRIGSVCNHGFRLDQARLALPGDGCRVVAVERNPNEQDMGRWHFGPEWLPKHAEMVAWVLGLDVGATVTVLLDDGRVVATKTRGKPWGPDVDALVSLDGFTVDYWITRVRPHDWTWGIAVDSRYNGGSRD